MQGSASPPAFTDVEGVSKNFGAVAIGINLHASLKIYMRSLSHNNKQLIHHSSNSLLHLPVASQTDCHYTLHIIHILTSTEQYCFHYT